MDSIIITRLALALVLGLIIGLERGWTSREGPEELGSDGLRNFGLVGLFGGIAALLAEQWGNGLLAIIFLGLSILVSTSYVLSAQKSQDYGSTTEFALLITFVLGALVVKGFNLEAVAVAVIVTWLLKLKPEIHQMLIWLTKRELVATLQLLLLALVTLPLLPNKNMGPWEALNPRAIGLLVLLIIGISYVGYFIIRLWQHKAGILLVGLLGGLASSTATTIALARIAKQEQAPIKLLATAIALATGTMSPRLLLTIAIINSQLASQLAISLIILGLIPVIIALILIGKRINQKTTNVPLKLSNPFEISIALQYSFILIVLSLLIKLGEEWLGNTGVYLVSALSGLADVDAVSISLARAANQTMPLDIARGSIFLAVTMNTLVKIGLTRFIGGKELAYWCGIILLSTLALSGLTIWGLGEL
jgi:uncharacterized membrane protein (DUF4010 family)